MNHIVTLGIYLFFSGLSVGSLVMMALVYRISRNRELRLFFVLFSLLLTDFLISMIVFLAFPDGKSLVGSETSLYPVFVKIRQFVTLLLQGLEIWSISLLTRRLLKQSKSSSGSLIFFTALAALMIFELYAFAVIPHSDEFGSYLISIPYRLFDYSILSFLLICLIKTIKADASGVKGRILKVSVIGIGVFLPYLLAEDILSLVLRRSVVIFSGLSLLSYINIAILFFSVKALVSANAEQGKPMLLDDFCRKHSISPRERDVLEELLRGYKYKEIAEHLHISCDTVKSHASKLYKKTESRGRQELKYRITRN